MKRLSEHGSNFGMAWRGIRWVAFDTLRSICSYGSADLEVRYICDDLRCGLYIYSTKMPLGSRSTSTLSVHSEILNVSPRSAPQRQRGEDEDPSKHFRESQTIVHF